MEKEQKQESSIDTFTDRMPLSKCKELLKADKRGWSDEQVLRMRNFLYEIAALDYKITMQVFQLEDLEQEQAVHTDTPIASIENNKADQEQQLEEQTKTIQLPTKQYRKAS